MNSSFLSVSLLLVLNVSEAFAQSGLDCGGSFDDGSPSQTCSENSTAYTDVYRLQGSYIPGTNPFVDEIVIPFNLIILADDNGDNGAYTPAQWANENQATLLGWLNGGYENTALPTDPVSGFPSGYWLQDTKIRFEINEVYFYDNSGFFYAPYPGGVGDLRAHHLSTNPEAQSFINCYLVKNSVPGAGGASWTSNTEPRIVSYGWDDPSIPGTWQGDYWYWEHHLPHELGHQLELDHTYGGPSCCPETTSGIDLLSDVFFTPFQFEQPCPPGGPPTSPTDFCTNNVMSGHNQDNNFLSPLQAGRAHRSVRSASARHFAYGYSSIKHEITSDETWDFEYKSYNDIVVKSGKTLTITCRLEMIKGSKIIVEPNAKLIVDGGTITAARSPGSANYGRWNGIYVSGNSTASQTVSPQLFGTVELKNGATIEHADGALNNFGLTSGGSTDWDAIGGVIQCDDAIFLNNWRSAQFMVYQNKNSGGNPIDDRSYFRKCDFSIDNDMLNGSHMYAHISEWGTDGVNVYGCSFSNTQTAAEADRGRGILTEDADMIVSDHCNGTTYPCPPSQQVHNSFSGLRYGVHTSGSGTGNAITSVLNADFDDNVFGVYAASVDDITLHGCTLVVNGQNAPVGIYLEQSPNTDIYENVLTVAGGAVIPAGIVAKNLGSTATPIYNNSFTGFMVGCSAQGGNKNKTAGLQFLCNDYTNSFAGISVVDHNPHIGMQGIAKNQGAYGDGGWKHIHKQQLDGLLQFIPDRSDHLLVRRHTT